MKIYALVSIELDREEGIEAVIDHIAKAIKNWGGIYDINEPLHPDNIKHVGVTGSEMKDFTSTKIEG